MSQDDHGNADDGAHRPGAPWGPQDGRQGADGPPGPRGPYGPQQGPWQQGAPGQQPPGQSPPVPGAPGAWQVPQQQPWHGQQHGPPQAQQPAHGQQHHQQQYGRPVPQQHHHAPQYVPHQQQYQPHPPQQQYQQYQQQYGQHPQYQQQPHYQQQYGQHPQYQQKPPKKLGRGARAALLGGAGAVVVAIAVVAAVVLWPSPGRVLSEARPTSPQELVEGYLGAVAEGNAAEALSYLPTDQRPQDEPLLTDEALARSLEIAPISEIEVGEVVEGDATAEVRVSYLMGGEPVDTVFLVVDRAGNGKWLLDGGLAQISTPNLTGLDLTVNGQDVAGGPLNAFVGTYEIATSAQHFRLEGGPLQVTAPGPHDTGGLTASLTDDGVTAFRDAVRESAEQCVSSSALDANCGLGLEENADDGTRLHDGTIDRSLSRQARDQLDQLEPLLHLEEDITQVTGMLGNARVNVTARCTQNGVTGPCELTSPLQLGGLLGLVTVDMASEDPAVTWAVDGS
ncbi:hypothetical protein [Georgenia alba]|uniref:DUF4878 domain-containing protein n=1 Tax=Georgenia alba TaxID=2233858 RepID=A0ABW2Q8J5_9MICO